MVWEVLYIMVLRILCTHMQNCSLIHFEYNTQSKTLHAHLTPAKVHEVHIVHKRLIMHVHAQNTCLHCVCMMCVRVLMVYVRMHALTQQRMSRCMCDQYSTVPQFVDVFGAVSSLMASTFGRVILRKRLCSIFC